MLREVLPGESNSLVAHDKGVALGKPRGGLGQQLCGGLFRQSLSPGRRHNCPSGLPTSRTHGANGGTARREHSTTVICLHHQGVGLRGGWGRPPCEPVSRRTLG